ncbi:hypothetical protein G3I31_22975, partial [Streptomyces sp. SID9913]
VAAVRRLAAGRTVLLVVHRPALLSVADRVVRLTEPDPTASAGHAATAGTTVDSVREPSGVVTTPAAVEPGPAAGGAAVEPAPSA